MDEVHVRAFFDAEQESELSSGLVRGDFFDWPGRFDKLAKEDNANETKLGVSATGGVNAGIYHADASASFSTASTVRKCGGRTGRSCW